MPRCRLRFFGVGFPLGLGAACVACDRLGMC